METYIEEALASDYIRPSTSPTAGIFFVEKKDGRLSPCIEYQGLNNVTVKYRYPLPLVPSALEQLREARVYNKLDSHFTFTFMHLADAFIQSDLQCIQAIHFFIFLSVCQPSRNGRFKGSGSHRMASPQTVKELQRFLGFANFCHRFIRNYSLIADPDDFPPKG